MRRDAFTIIELLVVIVIIAVLIGILAPALGAIRQQSRSLLCRSNLRQLSLAVTIYEQENEVFPYGFKNDMLLNMTPPPGGYPGDHVYDFMGWWWFHFLAGTLGKNFEQGTVFWCPARNVREHLTKPNILCANYGVNRAVCKDARRIGENEFFGTPLGLGQIPRPSQTLLLLDSGYSLISWRGVTNADIQHFENPMRAGAFYIPGLKANREREISPGFEWDALNGRHPNKTVNVVFADGHSSRLRADDLFVEEIDGNYTNRAQLWLPE